MTAQTEILRRQRSGRYQFGDARAALRLGAHPNPASRGGQDSGPLSGTLRLGCRPLRNSPKQTSLCSGDSVPKPLGFNAFPPEWALPEPTAEPSPQRRADLGEIAIPTGGILGDLDWPLFRKPPRTPRASAAKENRHESRENRTTMACSEEAASALEIQRRFREAPR
jgi:hypothetical protein